MLTGTASGNAAGLTADDGVYFSATAGYLGAPSWYGSFTAVPDGAANLRVTYVGRASRTCTLAVSIYDWLAAAWAPLRQLPIGTSDVTLADMAPAGAAASYRSAGGEVRVRVVCSAPTWASYTSSGDLLTLTYDT